MRNSDIEFRRQRRKRNAPSAIRIEGQLAYVEVRLDGTYAIIDVIDIPLVAPYKWHFAKDAVRKTKPPQLSLHRVILGLDANSSIRVDHINGDPLDNRRCNLRLADAAQNGWNRTRLNRNNRSGAAGVSRTRLGHWQAYIDIRRKRIRLGTFHDFAAAVAARRQAELELFGEWAPHDVTNHKSPVRGDAGGEAPIV